LQCGAVLPSSVRACNFCEDTPAATSVAETARACPAHATRGADAAVRNSESDFAGHDNSAWRDELTHRLETYRGRKKKSVPNTGQTRLPFESAASVALDSGVSTPPASNQHSDRHAVSAAAPTVAVTSATSGLQGALPQKEEFSFTIAIGRPPKKREDETRMIIDVSLPPEKPECGEGLSFAPAVVATEGLLPTASVEERRLAALIDSGCLLFAYGAFLALFSALGGEFTVSKLSGAVCVATFAIVYLQYFALFTIFGGTTPGMMMRSLQVVSFTGEAPTPRQMLLRSAGYLLSAGTFFLGFVWAMWDEDTLTWHDRISRTYLSAIETYADVESAETAPIRT
jgi:uncharacterized RDD family membrane protein YckC